MSGQFVEHIGIRPATALQQWDSRWPKPMPAIQEKYLAHKKGDSCNAPDAAGLIIGSMIQCTYSKDEYGKRPVCADKSRIKLTAEDGKVWCHKPQVQP